MIENQTKRKNDLINFCMQILTAEKPVEAVNRYREIMETITAREVVWVVDELVKKDIPIPELKTGINKILNLFYKSLNSSKECKLPEKSFLQYLKLNNNELDIRLKELKPLIKQVNKEADNTQLIQRIIERFEEILLFEKQYIIKENILFPMLEKHWDDFRCVQIMWSFHDDIRRNIKEIIKLLYQENLDLFEFNNLAGKIFFNMYAIIFREEKILFPLILESISDQQQDQLINESLSFEWPFINPIPDGTASSDHQNRLENNEIDLKTGVLLPNQIRWMLNHLPVDITYVDENNKVKYFSSPKKRIFPRSNSIIGRDVKNCHPPESVHVVEEIIEAFRSGKKEKADFWIKINQDLLLIQYFALHDEMGVYKGVIEVSQEITEIKSIDGEKRLLDWK